MTFVPELTRTSPDDPWAHRKGEPRPLALLWAVYLMGSALLTLFAVRSLTVPSTSQFVYGCRGLLLMLLAGTTLLWPMTRLSQRFPENAGRSLLGDLVVLLVPAQAVLWPMPLLTRWSLEVNAALALLVIGWTALIGSVLATAYRHPAGHLARLCWMVACLGLVWGVPALLALGATTGLTIDSPAALLLSPFTAVFGLTTAPSGLSPMMNPMEWVLVLAPLAASAPAWAWALGRGPGQARPASAE